MMRGAALGRGLRAGGGARASSTLRRDAITGNWVIFAPERRNRPQKTVAQRGQSKCVDHPPHDASCPFCVGNEAETPPTLLEMAHDDGEAGEGAGECWALRVVANAFPAVAAMSSSSSGGSDRQQQLDAGLLGGSAILGGAVNVEVPAVGVHEVVIESPRHNACTALQPTSATARILRAWRARGRALRDTEPGLQHVLYFKNQGSVAGASLVHPHSQIVGLPLVARDALSRQKAHRTFFERHGVSVFARQLEEELRGAAPRVVERNEHFVAFVPFAAISPFHLFIVPLREGTAHFEDADDATLAACAEILTRCLRRQHYALDEPNWNMVLRSAPLQGRNSQRAFDANYFSRWHIVMTPRLSAGAMAGFEIGSGMFTNGNFPEEDAAILRAVDEALVGGP